jgi:hypothetical protein
MKISIAEYEWNISDEYALNLIKSNCEYCDSVPGERCNGIDRINNLLGYIPGNVVPCCKTCNKIKRCISPDVLLKQIENIIHQKQIRKIDFKNAILDYNEYMYNALRRNKSFEISEQKFEETRILNCYLCDLSVPNGIDRLNNDIGYTDENIRPCCSTCNYMKCDYNLDGFIEHLIKMYETTSSKGYEKLELNQCEMLITHNTKEEKEKIKEEIQINKETKVNQIIERNQKLLESFN